MRQSKARGSYTRHQRRDAGPVIVRLPHMPKSIVKGDKITQRDALLKWKDQACLCLQCFCWFHEDQMHLDTCRACLTELYDDIFIDLRRPVILPEAKLKPFPRPREWPSDVWFKRYWTNKGISRSGIGGGITRHDDYEWLLTEEELYNAYVAVIEGAEAFLKELQLQDFDNEKAHKATNLLAHRYLIKKSKNYWERLDYYE